MKREKGFTLIELLAVIVILAIIALIATPIILNIVNKAKKSAFLDSTYGIMESMKLYYTESMLDGGLTSDKLFVFNGDIPEGLNYSGSSPKGGEAIVKVDGTILLSLHNKEWCAKKGETDRNITLEKYEEGKCNLTDAPVISNADTSGAEKPELNGLLPIKWNGSTWIVADSNNSSGENQWYDYNTGMWANAVSVTSSYRNAKVGTVVPEDAILAYFVWVPRYEYMYTNLGTNYAGGTKEQPGEIKVNFLKRNIIESSSNEYKIHPAFHFGGTELGGIWVGKFETSIDSNNECNEEEEDCAEIVYIKPNLNSLRDQNVSNEFILSQKFSRNENKYGISSSADAHMMKNSEWGAVAYLSQSKYGKYGNSSYSGANKEIYINNYWNDSENVIITGCSGGTPNAIASDVCVYTYEKEGTGTGASTTGTIYGIYDMNGGANEYVMGVYRGNDASSTWGASSNGNEAGFSSAPASKYYDEYKTTDGTTACNNNICYGHSLSETSGWYNDTAYFIGADSPWLLRGGYNSAEQSGGIFHSGGASGEMVLIASFRVVLLGE